ncbi:MAG: NAD(P)/FAD-dependent oxidoreductase [Rhodococcus sp. (in: high G+C Gram-positive bacteria)]|uniref:phytoene desaturase family protein n=1 Tax=Rhodococcus sp. TaxID=1831 RepID=UPI003BAF8F29
MTTAVVVGSGPNGLAAAIHLARQGISVRVLEADDSIGGGTRSSEHTIPGVIHDDCSAFHPTGVASPFLQSLGLEDYGLRWLWPEIDLAHPLDSGSAGVLWRNLERTAANLGEDGKSWKRMFAGLSGAFDDLTADVFRPIVHWPEHPFRLAGFGINALAPASLTVRRWKRAETRALFGGVAAHAFSSLHAPMSSSVGLMLTAAGHAHGWPVAEGGSRSITDAMALLLTKLGGTIETGVRVDALDSLGSPDIVMLNVSPRAVLRMAGDRLPGRVAGAYRRYKYGPAAFKVDFAVQGHIPWINEYCRKAGTLHLGGTFEQVADAEGKIVRGIMPDQPVVLVGQQYLADPSRSVGDVNPIWAYAHVPHGYRGDATEAIIAQIERFAPGFRQQIVGQYVRSATQMEQYNANYVGGDISVGANNALQIAMRPRIGLDPYSTGIPGVYLCSSATAPGAGVHGMCGYNAAESALSHLERA